MPGVDRGLVKSLFSPSTRFVEVVEDGFAGGPVIPADFSPSSEWFGYCPIRTSKKRVLWAGWWRMISVVPWSQLSC